MTILSRVRLGLRPSAALVSIFATVLKSVRSNTMSSRSKVTFHGTADFPSPRFPVRVAAARQRISDLPYNSERPPDPNRFLNKEQHERELQKLIDWFSGGANDKAVEKKRVLCLTGAGISTESGVADYRGHLGSYHRGHKPMVHDQFMNSEYQRKRYWGRGMVGWKHLASAEPNEGHFSVAKLEKMGKIGVNLDDKPEFYGGDDHNRGVDSESNFSPGPRKVSLITQNVDSLHRRAGSKEVVELHGRNDRVLCTRCGNARDRHLFQSELELINKDWLEAAKAATQKDAMRPDGDAALEVDNYDEVIVPPCDCCGSFFKPDVVFFGDSVPINKVALCRAAVEHCDGLLVVGSSLAVYSAFRHVRAACEMGVPVAILNVGTTRAETEKLPICKIEAPAGATLAGLVAHLQTGTTNRQEVAQR